MIFKKIFILFRSASSIEKVNLDDLFKQINIYSGKNRQIFGVYLSTKYAYYKRYIDLSNNIDYNIIRIKFFEECSPNTNFGYYLSLMLDDEPNNLRQTYYFDINKWNTETAITPIPSCRPGLVYTNSVKKTTSAADGAQYMLSKCDSYFISPTLERVEEVYGDLTVSSPFPLSIGTYQNNVTPINYNLNIVWNSTSISNPIKTDMPPFLLNNNDTGNGPYTSYLTKFQDPTQIAKITLLLVISTNLTIIFKDRRTGKSDYEPFPLRPYQKIYILPGSDTQNRQQKVFGNGDIVYFNKRIDHNIQVFFKRTNNNIQECTLSAMWGYYSNLMTEYLWVGSRDKYTITPIKNIMLFDIGIPTYCNIYTLVNNVFDYSNGYENKDVYIIIGYRMEAEFLNDIPYITYYNDSNSVIFISDLPFISYNLLSNVENRPTIIDVTSLADKDWVEYNTQLLTQEFNFSDKSMSSLNIKFDRPINLNDLKKYLQFGVFGTNSRISKDIVKFNNPLAGRYQEAIVGWQYVSINNTFLCFEKIEINGENKDPFILVINFRSYYGIRFRYTGKYTTVVNNNLYIQSSDLQSFYSRSFNIQVNQLWSLQSLGEGCPINNLVICLLFISKSGIEITTEARRDINENLICELIKTQPPYSTISKKTAIELPTSYLCSTIDALNDVDFFNFKRKGVNNILFGENYEPKLIRQDYEIVKDNPAYTLDATFNKDYYAIRLPNFYKNFPLSGLPIYIIPFDKFELRYVTNDKMFSAILPKGYTFTIILTSSETKLTVIDGSKECIFNYNDQTSSYDIFITLDFDKTNIIEKYQVYKTVCASACIANCAGTQPIDVYSNIISSYEEYGSICNSSIIDTNRTKSEYINKNIHSFKIKAPIVNMAGTFSFNLQNLEYSNNSRQLLLTILLEINYFS
jgi:hypothetical protein